MQTDLIAYIILFSVGHTLLPDAGAVVCPHPRRPTNTAFLSFFLRPASCRLARVRRGVLARLFQEYTARGASSHEPSNREGGLLQPGTCKETATRSVQS